MLTETENDELIGHEHKLKAEIRRKPLQGLFRVVQDWRDFIVQEVMPGWHDFWAGAKRLMRSRRK